MSNSIRATLTLVCLLFALNASRATRAADWPNWRGPQVNGTSTATGLISNWSREGENLIWRRDFTGRSTPVVLKGRVCANGRVGEGVAEAGMVGTLLGHRLQELECFDDLHVLVAE